MTSVDNKEELPENLSFKFDLFIIYCDILYIQQLYFIACILGKSIEIKT